MAGAEGRRIVAAIEGLCGELGYSEELSEQSRRWAGQGESALGRLDEEDEVLIAQLRGALARLVCAAQRGEGGSDGATESAVIAALDGAELVMRGEILLGNGTRLRSLVPSFAFLTTLPVTSKERALALSRRAVELLEDSDV